MTDIPACLRLFAYVPIAYLVGNDRTYVFLSASNCRLHVPSAVVNKLEEKILSA